MTDFCFWQHVVDERVKQAREVLVSYGLPDTVETIKKSLSSLLKDCSDGYCIRYAIFIVIYHNKLLRCIDEGKTHDALSSLTDLMLSSERLNLYVLMENKPIKKGMPPIREMNFTDDIPDCSLAELLNKGLNQTSSKANSGRKKKISVSELQEIAIRLFLPGYTKKKTVQKVYDEVAERLLGNEPDNNKSESYKKWKKSSEQLYSQINKDIKVKALQKAAREAKKSNQTK